MNLAKHYIRDFYSFRMDVPKLSYSFAVGFGFDPRTNDYMVVRIAFPCTSSLLLHYNDEVILTNLGIIKFWLRFTLLAQAPGEL